MSDSQSSKTFKRIDFLVELKSAVLLNEKTGDENLVPTKDYIPGTVLRGIFANRFIKEKKLGKNAHKNETFKKWFLSQELYFLNGNKIHADDSEKPVFTMPIPFSFQFEKSKPKKIEDWLWETKITKKETKSVGGFAVIEKDENDNKYEIDKIDIVKAFHFHHQRTNPLSGRSTDSEIFNYEALCAGQIFKCAVVGNSDSIVEFKSWLGSEFDAQMGRSRSTEYGQVKIKLIDTETINDICEQGDIESKWSLTFISDAILPNENGFCVVSCDSLRYQLYQFLKKNNVNEIALNDISIKNNFMRAVRLENYISIWQARRPAQMAFQKGSCFLIEIKEEFFNDHKKIIQNCLCELQKTGLGLRRNEGFGKFFINFHDEDFVIINDITEEKEQQKKKQEKRDEWINVSPMPGEIKEKFRTIIDQYIINWMIGEIIPTLKDGVKDPPKNSQLSRLQNFITRGNSFTELKNRLSELKENAKKQLSNCHINGSSLEQIYLENKKDTILFSKYKECLREIDSTLLEKMNIDPEKSKMPWPIFKHVSLAVLYLVQKQKEVGRG